MVVVCKFDLVNNLKYLKISYIHLFLDIITVQYNYKRLFRIIRRIDKSGFKAYKTDAIAIIFESKRQFFTLQSYLLNVIEQLWILNAY